MKSTPDALVQPALVAVFHFASCQARTLWLTGASSSASLRHLLQLPVQLLSGVINEADALRRNCQATSNASVKLNGLGGASLNIWRL
ncbi:hypothetical protein T02_5606 [Trichinella nativa]|uniref:Uncharacterized protein n=3 Tax=Trichinella TaxID=6333 RepID=A0A0V1L4X9_9BILA|nr:hypothetical protein T06_2958 [Trichinella sp. T6]KRY29934.1 hypothetical protein T01_1011 [Trichinella spiralis]KRY48506.1 hypothetical protein T03_14692 [Trichinella britovi]KRZ54513.1 hypothetical protein T02_5606 [Trichinella nativa]KRZ93952.1 hypothetical protein T08_16361 [Trichinella sp. T8]